MTRPNETDAQVVARRKTVRVYALDPKYRRNPYPAVAAEDTSNDTFITGQQFIPGVTKDGHYLTKEEMLGNSPLPAQKAKRFPYVINPTTRVNIMHASSYDLSTYEDGSAVNPKDMAILNFIRLQDFVAPTKADYRKGKHYFYIDDREATAERNVTQFDLEFSAMEFIYKNTAPRRMKELCLLISYYVKGFKVDFLTFNDTMIKERLLSAAKENPKDVLACATEGAKNELFVLKLAHYKIIQRKMDGFFDGGRYLGATPSEVFVAMNRKENDALLSRCTQALLKEEEEGETAE